MYVSYLIICGLYVCMIQLISHNSDTNDDLETLSKVLAFNQITY